MDELKAAKPRSYRLLAVVALAASTAAVASYFHRSLSYYRYIQPSAELMSVARRLSVEDRVLAHTKEVWPECVNQKLTAAECKEFIEDEILSLFTGADRNIKTKVVGKRSLADTWYNAVVIIMDDNDWVLGRDADGLVHYDFEWEGSGLQATVAQQSEIPPVAAVETELGCVEGATVKTLYNPEATNDEALVQSALAAASGARSLGALQSGGGPGLDSNDEALVQDASAASSGSRSLQAGAGAPFDFTGPPLTVEPKLLLVEGASTQDAIAGTATDPINGGVVLDSATTGTQEGTTRLQAAMDEATAVPPAGNRAIGPFRCKGMTGYECCLMIKKEVPDADVNGRAIQCFLDYDETTCKKKYWIDNMSQKKVLILSNHFGLVNQAPRILGTQAACGEHWVAPVQEVLDQPASDPASDAECGCTACTETILGRSTIIDANGFTCGQRIEHRKEHEGEDEATACFHVSNTEFPDTCGPECDPTRCAGLGPTPAPVIAPPAPAPEVEGTIIGNELTAEDTVGTETVRNWAQKYSEDRCGSGYGGQTCPEGECCSTWGFCGSRGAWCNAGCQSQCWADGRPDW